MTTLGVMRVIFPLEHSENGCGAVFQSLETELESEETVGILPVERWSHGDDPSCPGEQVEDEQVDRLVLVFADLLEKF